MAILSEALSDLRLRPDPLRKRLLVHLRLWRDRQRERRQLAAMSERELGDIRLNRLDVLRELRKPFWRL